MDTHKLTTKNTRLDEWLIERFLLIAGISSMLIIALIFVFLFKEAVRFFATANPFDLIGKWIYDDWEGRTVFKMMWQSISEIPKYSIIPLICGSFLVAFPATIISGILGIGCAIYLWGQDAQSVFNGMMVVDKFALFFKFLFPCIAALIVLASTDYVAKFKSAQGEYYALILLSTLGMMLISSATDLVSVAAYGDLTKSISNNLFQSDAACAALAAAMLAEYAYPKKYASITVPFNGTPLEIGDTLVWQVRLSAIDGLGQLYRLGEPSGFVNSFLYGGGITYGSNGLILIHVGKIRDIKISDQTITYLLETSQ